MLKDLKMPSGFYIEVYKILIISFIIESAGYIYKIISCLGSFTQYWMGNIIG